MQAGAGAWLWPGAGVAAGWGRGVRLVPGFSRAPGLGRAGTGRPTEVGHLLVAAGAGAGVDVVDARQAAEQRRELVELGGGEVGADELLAGGGVRAGGAGEHLSPVARDHRVGHPGIRGAAAAGGEPGLLEPVQQARHPGRSQAEALGEVDSPHLAALGV